MTPPTCTDCGDSATQQVNVGHVLRGSVWRRAMTWLCPECAASAVREREIARAG